jgi:hypothetical protein
MIIVSLVVLIPLITSVDAIEISRFARSKLIMPPVSLIQIDRLVEHLLIRTESSGRLALEHQISLPTQRS